MQVSQSAIQISFSGNVLPCTKEKQRYKSIRFACQNTHKTETNWNQSPYVQTMISKQYLQTEPNMELCKLIVLEYWLSLFLSLSFSPSVPPSLPLLSLQLYQIEWESSFAELEECFIPFLIGKFELSKDFCHLLIGK